jgi:hypothetical protein
MAATTPYAIRKNEASGMPCRKTASTARNLP